MTKPAYLFRGFALGLVLLAAPAGAGQLTSAAVKITATVPVVQPNWPVPNEPNQLFYLQRSTNPNTVVYTALFDAAGNLRADRPGQVYWRRYNTTGEIKPLKAIEQRFAYGLSIRPGPEAGSYTVWLKPLPELPMTLRQTGPGRAELTATIGGRAARPVYAYVTVDESRLIPSVVSVALHGVDVATGQAVTEIFSVSGGEITK